MSNQPLSLHNPQPSTFTPSLSDTTSWTKAPSINIIPNLRDAIDAPIYDSPPNGLIFSILKSSDSSISSNPWLLVTLGNNQQFSEGIIQAQNIKAANTISDIWSFFANQSQSIHIKSKYKSSSNEIVSPAKITPPPYYQCLLITNDDNIPLDKLCLLLSNSYPNSQQDIQSSRIFKEKNDAWTISSDNPSFLDSLCNSSPPFGITSITRRPESSMQFIKERQRWASILKDKPSSSRDSYLNILNYFFQQDLVTIISCPISERNNTKTICIEFKSPEMAYRTYNKYFQNSIAIPDTELIIRFLPIQSENLVVTSFHEATFINPKAIRYFPPRDVILFFPISSTDGTPTYPEYTDNGVDIKLVFPSAASLQYAINNQFILINNRREHIVMARDAKYARNQNQVRKSSTYTSSSSEITALKEQVDYLMKRDFINTQFQSQVHTQLANIQARQAEYDTNQINTANSILHLIQATEKNMELTLHSHKLLQLQTEILTTEYPDSEKIGALNLCSHSTHQNQKEALLSISNNIEQATSNSISTIHNIKNRAMSTIQSSLPSSSKIDRRDSPTLQPPNKKQALPPCPSPITTTTPSNVPPNIEQHPNVSLGLLPSKPQTINQKINGPQTYPDRMVISAEVPSFK